MSDPTSGNDETTQWFDEEFARAIQPARESSPMSIETYMERLEHQDLVASFRRRNRSRRDD